MHRIFAICFYLINPYLGAEASNFFFDVKHNVVLVCDKIICLQHIPRALAHSNLLSDLISYFINMEEMLFCVVSFIPKCSSLLEL